MDKKVSVIIPVVEDNTYLVRCLNRLKMQTVSPVEIIIAEYDVEIKGKCENNVFCLSSEEQLVTPKMNMEIEYTKNDFFEQIFDEERRIATNVKKAISLASGEYILFCNVTSILSQNVIEELSKALDNGQFGMTKLYVASKNIDELDGKEIIWGKLFSKKFLMENKIYKWNFLEILRWIDDAENGYETIGVIDNAMVYDDSYDEIIQRVFTVKLKDDVPKFRKYFSRRIKNGQDLFEHINTYDYIKVNVITNLIEQYIDDFDMVVDLTDKYIIPIFNNRMNAKKNRKELLHQAFCEFFNVIERDAVHYEMLLMLFYMDKKMCEVFKACSIDTFDKLYLNWWKMMNGKGGQN